MCVDGHTVLRLRSIVVVSTVGPMLRFSHSLSSFLGVLAHHTMGLNEIIVQPCVDRSGRVPIVVLEVLGGKYRV